MVRTLRFIGKYRRWRRIACAGAAGFAVTFVALEAISSSSSPLAHMSTALVAVAGAILGIALAGSLSLLAIIKRLRAENIRGDLALNNMLHGLCMFDSRGRLVVWNAQYQAMYKLESADIWRGCTLRHLLDVRKVVGTLPVDAAQYEADLKASLARGEIFTLETEMEDGRIIAVRIIRPWKAAGSPPTRMSRSTDAPGAISSIPVPSSTPSSSTSPVRSSSRRADDLTYLLLNQAAETYFGVDRATIIGKKAADILPRDHGPDNFGGRPAGGCIGRGLLSGRTCRHDAGQWHAYRNGDAVSRQGG